jgi:hypothetical protein
VAHPIETAPRAPQPVFVYSPLRGEWTLAIRARGTWFDRITGEEIARPTHWMPLPIPLERPGMRTSPSKVELGGPFSAPRCPALLSRIGSPSWIRVSHSWQCWARSSASFARCSALTHDGADGPQRVIGRSLASQAASTLCRACLGLNRSICPAGRLVPEELSQP